jgi:hypothetical protein
MKLKYQLLRVFVISNAMLYLPAFLYLFKSTTAPFSIVIPNMDGSEKHLTLMINSAWNITQHSDFNAKYDVEIEASNNKVLMTFHVIYPDAPRQKKLNRLLDIIKLARYKIITGAIEKELKIYKIQKNSRLMGYYFIASADYQSNSLLNDDSHTWPILTTLVYLIDNTFLHISIYSTSRQESVRNEVIALLP